MKFEEVLPALREGRKIIRPAWQKLYYNRFVYIKIFKLTHKGPSIVMYKIPCIKSCNSNLNEDLKISAVCEWRNASTEIIQADDFEVYDA